MVGGHGDDSWWGVTADGDGLSSEGIKNIDGSDGCPTLNSLGTILIVYLKWLSCLVCKFYVNKTVFKEQLMGCGILPRAVDLE